MTASGPVAPDGLDVWGAIVGVSSRRNPQALLVTSGLFLTDCLWLQAAETPPVVSPRTMIVHEFDEYQGIFAIRSGKWKLIWGNIGT